MKNIKLYLWYDGSRYHGWQKQPHVLTVQQVIEDSVSEVCGKEVSIIGCSRTDAGVHAINYVCNFLCDTKITGEKFAYILNTKLPKDIVVKSSFEVENSFNSRFDAIGKVYYYYIKNSLKKDPFLDKFLYKFHKKLDIEKMKLAASYLNGTHDFSAFMTKNNYQINKIRIICCSVEWVEENILDLYGQTINKNKEKIIRIKIFGNAFLYNMVRIISGTLVEVGVGKIKPEEIPDIIKSKDRAKSGPTLPANSLFLKKVFY